MKYISLEYKSSFYFFGNGGGIMLFVLEDNLAKLIGSEKHSIQSYYMELNLKGQEWLINCSDNPFKALMGKHLKLLGKNLDYNPQNMSLLFLLVISM